MTKISSSGELFLLLCVQSFLSRFSFTSEGVVVLENGLNPLLEALQSYVFIPFRTEPLYAQGFCWGMFLTIVGGGLFIFCRNCVHMVQKFFRPTKLPATRDGDSPFFTFTSCSLVFLLFFFLGIVIVIWTALS